MADEFPYKQLSRECFWNTFENAHPLDFESYINIKPRFNLAGAHIATAGRCFAQHIGYHLRSIQNCKFLDMEPPPAWLPRELHTQWGYNIYSARYGNIYTNRSLLQLYRRADQNIDYGEKAWIREGGYVDPYRPTVCRVPYPTEEEMFKDMGIHLERVKQLFAQCDTLIFTLGLTEAWRSRESGVVFPLIPGSRSGGGKWDAKRYEFINFNFNQVVADLEEFNSLMLIGNPKFKLILTVSPVPLAATATGQDVRIANSYSKSVLRAAAGYMREHHQNVEYFPSYEIITSPYLGGLSYMQDKRHVEKTIVAQIMTCFRKYFGLSEDITTKNECGNNKMEEDEKCDEEILLAYNALTNQGL